MPEQPTAWVDANVILRFLTREPREASEGAARLFASAQAGRCTLVLHPLVVAECVYVLERHYGYERSRTRDELGLLFDTEAFDVVDAKVVRRALDARVNHRVDFVDAFLAERARQVGHSVASFDVDLQRLGASILPMP